MASYAPLVVGTRDLTARLSRDRLVRATRTPDGPATIEIIVDPAAARADLSAWGDGASWLIERADDLLGEATPRYTPPAESGRVAELARAAVGVRLVRTHAVFEMLVKIVLEQLVSGAEVKRTYGALVRALGEPAPGPHELSLPLAPKVFADLDSARATRVGLLGRKLRTLKEIAWYASRLEQVSAMEPAAAEKRLLAVRGIGPWSARSVLLRGLGCADAVIVGDYNLPSRICYTLTGDRDADDARMLELLEPHRPYRGLVMRWVYAAGDKPPRRGPRQPLRPLPR